MTDPNPFPLQSFEDEVRAREEVARAEEVVREALAERDRIREEARREGLEQARAEAASLERARVAGDVAAAREVLRKAAEALRERRAELVAAAERDLVRLSLAIARKVVKREVALSGEAAAANVRRAIELAAGRQNVRILVHPLDRAAIESVLPEIRREFADLHDLALEESEAVGRGGCLLSTREGSVDATVATQLEEIERELLG